MSLGKPAPPNKRKKPSKIITDLSHIAQDECESEPETLDLGTKIRTPKDIMLEELSLMKNKGSKMFKMRQLRVEKFIYENNPDVFTSESMENFQKLGSSIGCQVMDVGGQLVGGKHVGVGVSVGVAGGGAPIPPPKPGSKGAGAGGAGGAGGVGGAAGASGAGGAGGHGGSGSGTGGTEGKGDAWSPLKGGGHGAESKKLIAKTYMSPWEKAMKGDESLTATLKAHMPGPEAPLPLVMYKSFNRTAMPFGGIEKANQLLKFQLPEATKEEPEPAVVYQQEIGCRPSFNRTPIGWVGSSEPSSIHMETEAVVFDGETDEL